MKKLRITTQKVDGTVSVETDVTPGKKVKLGKHLDWPEIRKLLREKKGQERVEREKEKKAKKEDGHEIA